MGLEERLYSVLIVSNADSFNQAILQMLPPSRYCPVSYAHSVSEAKRLVAEKSYDIVIINTPLPDEPGTRFAIEYCHRKNTTALLIVKNELYSDIYTRVLEHGIFVLPKPCGQRTVNQALDWLCTARESLRRLERKTVSVEERMEEIRIINRAKLLLISNRQMTEDEAHHFIERTAMDACITKKEVATTIINQYP